MSRMLSQLCQRGKFRQACAIYGICYMYYMIDSTIYTYADILYSLLIAAVLTHRAAYLLLMNTWGIDDFHFARAFAESDECKLVINCKYPIERVVCLTKICKVECAWLIKKRCSFRMTLAIGFCFDLVVRKGAWLNSKTYFSCGL